MNNPTTSDFRDIITRAVQCLAGVCDFAQTRDGTGFNGTDAQWGHKLAELSVSRPLTPWQIYRAHRMLIKYRKQLSGHGIELPASVPEPDPADLRVKVTAGPGTLALMFEDIPPVEIRTEIKKIDGWRFDGENEFKPWIIPANPQNAKWIIEYFNGRAVCDPGVIELSNRPVEPRQVRQARPEVTLDWDPDSSRVVISFDGFKSYEKYKPIIKGLPERKWNPDLPGKPWTVPLHSLKDVMNAIPGAQMSDILAKIATQVTTLAAMSRNAESDFDPHTKIPLYPFQRAGVQFIDLADGKAIIGDDMGLGKTCQALAWLNIHPEVRPAVIVCPQTVIINWQREINKFMTTIETVAVLKGQKPSALRAQLDFMQPTIYILNYDILSYWVTTLIDLHPAIVIYDEAHILRNQRAKPKEDGKRRGGSQRGNAGLDLAASVDHRLFLTGTAIVNRPLELYPLLNMCDPGTWGNWFRYAQRYANATRGGFGLDTSGSSNLEELHERIKPWFLRRTKDQVLTELPPKQRSSLVLDFDKGSGSEYDQVLSGVIDVIHGDRSRFMSDHILAKIEYAKQAAAWGKLPAAIDWAREFIESAKLVIFCTHQFAIDKFMEAFGDRAVKITGEITGQARQDAIDSFQGNENVRLMVANVKAGGVGINLTAASNVAFFEYPWTPGDVEQAADRCHRIGQKDSVTVWYIVAEGTIDEDIASLLQEKAEIIGKVLDGKPHDLEISIFGDLVKRIAERFKVLPSDNPQASFLDSGIDPYEDL